MFANGLSTLTQGVDVTANYASDFSEWGTVNWTAAMNYGETSISSVAPDPTPITSVAAGGTSTPDGQHLYDETAKSLLTDASPKFKIGLGALWTLGDFTVNLRETIYGPTKVFYSPNGGDYDKNEVEAAAITDMEVDYAATDTIGLAIGANNLFDQRPASLVFNGNTPCRWNTNVVNAPLSISPYGINGGYYYGRVTFNL